MVREAGVNFCISNSDGGGFALGVRIPEYVYQC